MNRIDINELDFEDRALLDGELFTGTAYEEDSPGVLLAEQDFTDGLKDGWGREWSRSGQLILETPYARGVCHGIARTWHEGGQLAMEKHCIHGIVMSEKHWNSAGQLVESFEIDKNSSQYREAQERLKW